jgi:hypothetical protein
LLLSSANKRKEVLKELFLKHEWADHKRDCD